MTNEIAAFLPNQREFKYFTYLGIGNTFYVTERFFEIILGNEKPERDDS